MRILVPSVQAFSLMYQLFFVLVLLQCYDIVDQQERHILPVYKPHVDLKSFGISQLLFFLVDLSVKRIDSTSLSFLYRMFCCLGSLRFTE